MKLESPSLALAVIGWGSVFVEGWLILTRIIPSDFLSWIFFVLYFVIALFASGVYAGKSKK